MGRKGEVLFYTYKNWDEGYVVYIYRDNEEEVYFYRVSTRWRIYLMTINVRYIRRSSDKYFKWTYKLNHGVKTFHKYKTKYN